MYLYPDLLVLNILQCLLQFVFKRNTLKLPCELHFSSLPLPSFLRAMYLSHRCVFMYSQTIHVAVLHVKSFYINGSMVYISFCNLICLLNIFKIRPCCCMYLQLIRCHCCTVFHSLNISQHFILLLLTFKILLAFYYYSMLH